MFAAAILLMGCNPTAPSMSSVMGSCDGATTFNGYVNCLKNNYQRDPNHSTVRAFYAQLDAINEDVQKGRLSTSKAKAAAYTAYANTIEAGNNAEYARRSQAYSNYQMQRLINCRTTGFCY